MAGPSRIEVTLPPLYPAQHAAIYNPARYVVIEASTKAGKTLGCIVWQMGRALAEDGEHWWIAPVYSQARIAFKRAVAMLPRECVVRSAEHPNMEIRLVSGATWAFKSGEKPDNLFGEDVRSAVIDEASRLREASWHAVRSTLTATRGPIRIIGNVRGRGTWHYRLARRAEGGESAAYHYAKLTALDAVAGGVIDPEEIEDARHALPAHVFDELYMCKPSDDGGNPFGIGYIERCIKPLGRGPVVAWGVDLARVHDWTVVVGLNRDGETVVCERWRDSWLNSVQRIKAIVGDGRGFVDGTGVGDPVSEMLRKEGVRLDPYVFTASSKQALMEALALSIQRLGISFPEGVIRDELEIYEYTTTRTGVRYTAPEGAHDDAVCALALANAALARFGGSAKFTAQPATTRDLGHIGRARASF